jgi:hypothetical protein
MFRLKTILSGFIYSDISLLDKDIDDFNIPGLAYAADKYMLDQLKMECNNKKC